MLPYGDPPILDLTSTYSASLPKPSLQCEMLIKPTKTTWRYMLELHPQIYQSLWDLIEPSALTMCPRIDTWDFRKHNFYFIYNKQKICFYEHHIETIFNITDWWSCNRGSIVNRLMIIDFLEERQIKLGHYGWYDCFGSVVIED